MYNMRKYLFLLIMPIIILFVNVQKTEASSLHEIKNIYSTELFHINEKINKTKNRFEIIALNRKKNEIKAIVSAFDKATNVETPRIAKNSHLNNFIISELNSINFAKNKLKSTLNAFDLAQDGINYDLINVGTKFIGNSKYVFGGGRNQHDISRGIFDCSSFVHWVFDQVNISLGDRTSVKTETLKLLGQDINLVNIMPGDLVFFDTYKKDGHVGIYAGNGLFIGAQSSTGVAFADMTTGYWKEKFNGRIKRIR